MGRPLAISVPAASAYVRIDSRCILRAYQPYWTDYYSGFYHVSGEVDCSGNSYPVKSEIEVCSQVYNGSTGQWYTVSGSCGTETTTAYVNYLSRGIQGVCGHEYRTWDWGYLTDDGASATYTSSGAVDCSQPA